MSKIDANDIACETLEKWTFDNYDKDHRNAFQFLLDNYVYDYGQVVIDTSNDYPEKDILSFVTGGWSENEALLNTILELWQMRQYYIKWERGGLHVFEVPKKWALEIGE